MSRLKKNIILYSHDSFGLGHLNRNRLISQELINHFQDEVNVVIITGTLYPFTLVEGVEVIKLPSLIKDDQGVYRPLTGNNTETIRKLRNRIIMSIIECLKPDLFLCDTYAHGVEDGCNELLPALAELNSSKCKIVLGLRDIVDDPIYIRKRWEELGIYDSLERYYDKILVYGSESIFDVVHNYGFSDQISQKLTYCGYVVPERKTCSLSPFCGDDLRFLVTVGGGRSGYGLIDNVLEQIRQLNINEKETLVTVGPFMPEHELVSLRVKYKDSVYINIIRFTNEVLELFTQTKVVIGHGGYNTLAMAMHLKKRLLVIPREKPRKEQLIRASIFSQNDLCSLFLESELSSDDFRKSLVAFPYQPAGFDASLFEGRSNVIAEIEKLLFSEYL